MTVDDKILRRHVTDLSQKILNSIVEMPVIDATVITSAMATALNVVLTAGELEAKDKAIVLDILIKGLEDLKAGYNAE